MFDRKTAEERADSKRGKLLKLARMQTLRIDDKALIAGIFLEVAAIRDMMAKRYGDDSPDE